MQALDLLVEGEEDEGGMVKKGSSENRLLKGGRKSKSQAALLGERLQGRRRKSPTGLGTVGAAPSCRDPKNGSHLPPFCKDGDEKK